MIDAKQVFISDVKTEILSIKLSVCCTILLTYIILFFTGIFTFTGLMWWLFLAVYLKNKQLSLWIWSTVLENVLKEKTDGTNTDSQR